MEDRVETEWKTRRETRPNPCRYKILGDRVGDRVVDKVGDKVGDKLGDKVGDKAASMS